MAFRIGLISHRVTPKRGMQTNHCHRKEEPKGRMTITYTNYFDEMIGSSGLAIVEVTNNFDEMVETFE
jgi:hypothetical protein